MSKNEPNSKINNDFESTFLRNILWITLVFVVCSPVLVYFIVYVIGHWLPEDLFKVVQVSDSKSWIGFAGSILGGSVTMIALVFTIRNENKKRILTEERNTFRFKEERASNYLPVIKFHGDDWMKDELCLKLSFVNDRPIRYFALKHQRFGDESLVKDLLLLEDIPFLYDKRDIDLLFTIDESKISTIQKECKILTVLTFEYNDILNIKRYEHKLEFFLEISPEERSGKFYLRPGDIKNFPVNSSHFFEDLEYPFRGN